MTEEEVKALQAELAQAREAHAGFMAQIKAHKQVIQSLLEESFNTRTNLNLFSDAHNQLVQGQHRHNAELQAMQAVLDSVNQQNGQFRAELEALKNPVAPEQPVEAPPVDAPAEQPPVEDQAAA